MSLAHFGRYVKKSALSDFAMLKIVYDSKMAPCGSVANFSGSAISWLKKFLTVSDKSDEPPVSKIWAMSRVSIKSPTTP